MSGPPELSFKRLHDGLQVKGPPDLAKCFQRHFQKCGVLYGLYGDSVDV